MPVNPWPAVTAVSEKVIVMCPQCGGRMFLSHTEPAVAAPGDIANFICAGCDYTLQHKIKSI